MTPAGRKSKKPTQPPPQKELSIWEPKEKITDLQHDLEAIAYDCHGSNAETENGFSASSFL